MNAPDAFIAMVRPSNEGHVITVWRDPHPKGHVPVNLTTIRGSVWDPAAADHLLLTTYGYVTAPGSRWQRMDDGRYGIHLIRAEEPKAPKAPTPLTPERLAEYAALEQAATKGPWEADSWEINSPTGWIGETCDVDDDKKSRADAAFIAAARTAVPELLAEVARLAALVAAMHAAAVGETRPPLLGLVEDVTLTRSSFLAQQNRAETLDGIARREQADRRQAEQRHDNLAEIARDALAVLADLMYDHPDPGSNAFGTSYLLAQALAATPATAKPAGRPDLRLAAVLAECDRIETEVHGQHDEDDDGMREAVSRIRKAAEAGERE